MIAITAGVYFPCLVCLALPCSSSVSRERERARVDGKQALPLSKKETSDQGLTDCQGERDVTCAASCACACVHKRFSRLVLCMHCVARDSMRRVDAWLREKEREREAAICVPTQPAASEADAAAAAAAAAVKRAINGGP